MNTYSITLKTRNKIKIQAKETLSELKTLVSNDPYMLTKDIEEDREMLINTNEIMYISKLVNQKKRKKEEE